MTEVFFFFTVQTCRIDRLDIGETRERERYDSSQCLEKLRRLKTRVGAARFRGFPGSPPAIHRISSSSNHRLRSSFCPQPTNLSNTPFLTLQDVGIHSYLDPEQVKDISIQTNLPQTLSNTRISASKPFFPML